MKEKNVKKPKSKARKIIEWVAVGILSVIFCFAAVCNIAKAVSKNDYGKGNAFGYSSYVVLTDSMEPVYKVDDAIITYREDPAEVVKRWNEIKDLNLDKTDERNINMTFVDGYTPRISSGDSYYTQQTNNVLDENNQPMVMTHQLFNVIVNEDVAEGNGKYIFFVHGINISEHQSGEHQYQAFSEKEYLGVVKLNSSFIGKASGFFSSVWGLIICLLIPGVYLICGSIYDLYKATREEDEVVPADGSVTNSSNLDNISEKDYDKLKQQMIEEMLHGKGDKK